MDILERVIAKKLYGGSGGGGGGGGGFPIGDGNTHIWVTLVEGATSPCLGLVMLGTATVDWGDGTEPDILTTTSNRLIFTPTHNYAAPGDYVITLTIDGSVELSGSTSAQGCCYLLRKDDKANGGNAAYASAIRKVETGKGITRIGQAAFSYCSSLTDAVISNSVTRYDSYIFTDCYSLKNVTLLGTMTSVKEGAFQDCRSLRNIKLPEGIASIGLNAFEYAHSLMSIKIPGSVSSIGNSAFSSCYSMAFYDFSEHTAVPALAHASAFNYIAPDCEIRVPAALVDEWKAATNWSARADNIVGV